MKNLLKKISLTIVAFGALRAQASQVSIQTISQDIQNLAQEIAYEASHSNLDLVKLHEVRAQLESVLQVLKNGDNPVPGFDYQACVDFSYSKYNQSFGSNTAMDFAVKACHQMTDLDVAKYIFEKAFLTYSAAGAMDMAAKYAVNNLSGKLAILDFAYIAYDRTLSAGSAIVNAAENTATVRQDSLGCLRYSYERRSQSSSSSAAMNAAFGDCR